MKEINYMEETNEFIKNQGFMGYSTLGVLDARDAMYELLKKSLMDSGRNLVMIPYYLIKSLIEETVIFNKEQGFSWLSDKGDLAIDNYMEQVYPYKEEETFILEKIIYEARKYEVECICEHLFIEIKEFINDKWSFTVTD